MTMKRSLIFLSTTITAAFLAIGAPEKKSYPDHWGNPPKVQTRDLRELPGGYGKGSGTLAKWIQKNLDVDAKGEGMKPLFDGKTLDAFEIKSGIATYELKDGVITGTTKAGSPNTFLCTKKKYADFELQFEVKCDNQLNSGVQIRSQLKGDKYGGRVNGPQVEIEASGGNGAESGYVYGEAAGGWLTPGADRKPHKHFKDGEWNQYKILAEGSRIQVWINGEQVSDLTHEMIYKTHSEGLIGLQVHGVGNNGPFSVSWKNMKIREIKK
ncbi:MAG: hypothetical protein ACI9MB_002748 [Verrucomicrobiales bacterium]|jgi:hypothetical protein